MSIRLLILHGVGALAMNLAAKLRRSDATSNKKIVLPTSICYRLHLSPPSAIDTFNIAIGRK